MKMKILKNLSENLKILICHLNAQLNLYKITHSIITLKTEMTKSNRVSPNHQTRQKACPPQWPNDKALPPEFNLLPSNNEARIANLSPILRNFVISPASRSLNKFAVPSFQPQTPIVTKPNNKPQPPNSTPSIHGPALYQPKLSRITLAEFFNPSQPGRNSYLRHHCESPDAPNHAQDRPPVKENIRGSAAAKKKERYGSQNSDVMNNHNSSYLGQKAVLLYRDGDHKCFMNSTIAAIACCGDMMRKLRTYSFKGNPIKDHKLSFLWDFITRPQLLDNLKDPMRWSKKILNQIFNDKDFAIFEPIKDQTRLGNRMYEEDF
jgi:hypothetical protein